MGAVLPYVKNPSARIRCGEFCDLHRIQATTADRYSVLMFSSRISRVRKRLVPSP